jgi:hypothetical protein
MVVWMQRFEICDFACKKVCIEWKRASSGELRYSIQSISENAKFAGSYCGTGRKFCKFKLTWGGINASGSGCCEEKHIEITLVWHPGFSLAQTYKIYALFHSTFRARYLLTSSSSSDTQIGTRSLACKYDVVHATMPKNLSKGRQSQPCEAELQTTCFVVRCDDSLCHPFPPLHRITSELMLQWAWDSV